MNPHDVTNAPSKPVVNHPGVFRNIQALRALAAMLVVFEHIGDSHRGIEIHYFTGQPQFFAIFGRFGTFGVDLFFAISGFIMIATTWKSFGKRGAAARFFLRRCIRIYPSYWLVLIPMTAVYLAARGRFTQFHSFHANVFASYALLPQIGEPLLGVSWTLVYEMSFYIVFSALLFLPRRLVPGAILTWCGFEIVFCFLFDRSSIALLSFLGRPFAIEFIFGGIVGLAYVNGKLPSSWAMLGFMCVPFFMICATSWHSGTMTNVERILVVGFSAALLIYGAVGFEVIYRVRAPSWAVALGDSSYALYLWHLPVLIALAQVIRRLPHLGLIAHVSTLVGLIGFVVLYSLFTYRYIERPMTAYLNKALSSVGVRIPVPLEAV